MQLQVCWRLFFSGHKTKPQSYGWVANSLCAMNSPFPPRPHPFQPLEHPASCLPQIFFWDTGHAAADGGTYSTPTTTKRPQSNGNTPPDAHALTTNHIHPTPTPTASYPPGAPTPRRSEVSTEGGEDACALPVTEAIAEPQAEVVLQRRGRHGRRRRGARQHRSRTRIVRIHTARGHTHKNVDRAADRIVPCGLRVPNDNK